MPAFTTAALALGGLVVGGIGMMNQNDALKEQQMAQTAAAASMTKAAGEMNVAQKDEIAHEQKVEAQRRTQMDLEYKRSQVQILRDTQKARAMSLAVATNQGAAGQSQSSSLSGALAGEMTAGRLQRVANTQNYQIGNNIFDINSQISQDRIRYADAQTAYGAGQMQYNLAGATGAAKAASAGAMMSLGGSMISNASNFGNIAKSSYSSFQNAMSFGTGPGSWQSQMG